MEVGDKVGEASEATPVGSGVGLEMSVAEGGVSVTVAGSGVTDAVAGALGEAGGAVAGLDGEGAKVIEACRTGCPVGAPPTHAVR